MILYAKEMQSNVQSILLKYTVNPLTPGTLTTEYIDERHIYAKRVNKNFYDYDQDGYEVILKEFKDQLLEEHLPQVYYCNVGTFLKEKEIPETGVYYT